MSNNYPAFPQQNICESPVVMGLTKLEYFAAAAMQGIITNSNALGCIARRYDSLESIVSHITKLSFVYAEEMCAEAERRDGK